MGSESKQKVIQQARTVRFRIVSLLLLLLNTIVLTTIPYSELFNIITSNKTDEIKLNSISNENEESIEAQLAKLNELQCNVSFTPPTPLSDIKPFWLTHFPESIDDSFLNKIITTLTGLKNRSYYASIPGELKKCSGPKDIVTCSNIHPMVSLNGGPDATLGLFQNQLLMVLRNPMTALPAYYNGKRKKYHDEIGQVPLDKWRETRDKYFSVMVDEWTSFVRSWKDSKFETGMYIVYEDLLSIRKGPNVVEELSIIFESAGFPVTPETDYTCIWYNAIGRDLLEQYQTHEYEYSDYIPGYTPEQQNVLLDELIALITEYGNDKTLLATLVRYKNSIKHKLQLDIPSSK